MDFTWSPEQLALREKVVAFAANELCADVIERDKSSNFDRSCWEKCATFGLQSLGVPEAYSGREDPGFLSGILAMEGFGYGCVDNGLAFGLNAQIWTVQLPLVHFGSEEQKAKFLPKFCSGEWIGAHALTEPDTGSDVFSMGMRAEKVDGGYVLNGTKCMVSFAPIADVVLVFANANPAMGHWGVTAFLVERGFEGFSTGVSQDKMGLRTVPMGEVLFNDCFVPEGNRLGKEGAGFAISSHSLEYERCSILASQLGTMERQLHTAVSYARERKQFGQSIGNFQSVSNRIADMKLRLETARLLLYRTAWLKERGEPAMMEAALLKLHLSESFIDSSLAAIRTHGGSGYLTETGVERDLRDAVGGVLYAGTSDIQRNIISKLLGL